jgi:hypothetical protein
MDGQRDDMSVISDIDLTRYELIFSAHACKEDILHDEHLMVSYASNNIQLPREDRHHCTRAYWTPAYLAVRQSVPQPLPVQRLSPLT